MSRLSDVLRGIQSVNRDLEEKASDHQTEDPQASLPPRRVIRVFAFPHLLGPLEGEKVEPPDDQPQRPQPE